MTDAPRAWRAGLTATALAATAPLALLATARSAGAEPVTVFIGFAWLLSCAVAPLVVRSATPAGLTRYALAGTVWGAGTVVAGTLPAATLGPHPVPHLAHAASLLGLAAIALQQLHHARDGRDESPLGVETALLAAVLAALGWDWSARAGLHGGAWWGPSAALVIVVASVITAATVVLAVEHPALRVPGAGLAVVALGTELAALTSARHPLVSLGAIAAALVGAYVLVLGQPRGGIVRHGGAAAAAGARRLRVATAVPAGLLLVDVALFIGAPRADGVMFVFFAAVVVAAGFRQAATARAVDRTHDRLSFQALHDPLTGLANRAALQSALHEPDRTQSLALIEVGGLDDVTDVLGVTVGEDVLRAAAANLREHVSALGGTTYRVRHDEFAVLLPGPPEETVRHLPGAFAAVSAAPLQVPGAGRFPVDAVAGLAAVASGPSAGGGREAMTPLLHADLALRDARLGTTGFSVYSGEVASAHARRLLLRERLALAVAEGTVDVHYQPIVNFTTGRVEKFEALARWDDVQLGRISPVEFIAVAEESNLVVALGEHVLRRAVASAHAAGVFAAGVRLAVNVSVVQLQAPGFADVVREILAQHGIPPHLLTLELTESVFLDSDSPAERVVTELAALGCQIAIDDFGTGYSAFGYLDRLPVHVLKVDRSLTQSMTGAGNGLSVVTAVVDLANRLGLTVVVEGVETDEEAEICRSIQAGLGQGWLYSAAVTADRIGAELAREYPVSPGAVR
ncbi:EAL domain-containing protein (putative c-di-GMP-specific phosphodiesterase class I)/GGDEF domain-containing protein [Kineococcus radiotolerans]|uniref:EAL domain-containing protein (Putative c-di-GMP-specific phosphodiesterase class I)/GGDEF domain-containing protein n=1 Tax=Kineococcus radiotolerans TaxID=131568 RepID=A0A7W4TLA5_KINRA|nr:bifunctional diguanylate cyclase/phosphodiesterase [Kineococcus radiotolerans]MBB2901012.1 EAL domain-containing protein (putative c-di-GMP-specific phosphodiesterase class I)/GGDEF domain-containing protein [Kineococcus radiotolerans]